MMYLIYDENGELMRWTRYKVEAVRMIKLYQGWSCKYVPKMKPKFQWADAPF